MRRLLALLVLSGAAFAAAGACSVELEGGLEGKPDGGGGTDGGQTVVENCFPPSKACPDGADGLVCVGNDDPQKGCMASTACEPCIVPHASAKCVPKGCAVDHCDAGWSDCNTDPSDGCETSLDNDPMNCGACGTDCSLTGAGFICQAGKCVTNDCQPPTTANCDKDPTNGCEVDLLKPDNCSFCGNVCNLPHAISACEPTPSGTPIARCIVKDCVAGWSDCDGNPANGCESSDKTDPTTCGGCGKKCNSTNGVAGCVNGTCNLLCNPGFGNCDNDIDNGCEVNLQTHVSNCGACGNACPAANGTPICTAGQCATGTCSSDYADCDQNPSNGCETGVVTDPKNCGGCGVVCPGTANGFPTCANSTCGVGCSPGFSTCGSGTTCFDTLNDPVHCGCTQCPGPTAGTGTPSCSGGKCSVTCTPGLTLCGTQCLDLKTNNANCGVCGKVCTAELGGTSTCQNGQCVTQCPTGVAICDNKCVDVFTDEGNCGACAKKCGLGQFCKDGTCQCYIGKTCGNYCAQCCKHPDCASNKCCYGFCC